MKTSTPERGHAPASKPRRARRTRIEDPGLKRLASALEAPPAVQIGPPQPVAPRRDPEVWASLFGFWG